MQIKVTTKRQERERRDKEYRNKVDHMEWLMLEHVPRNSRITALEDRVKALEDGDGSVPRFARSATAQALRDAKELLETYQARTGGQPYAPDELQELIAGLVQFYRDRIGQAAEEIGAGHPGAARDILRKALD